MKHVLLTIVIIAVSLFTTASNAADVAAGKTVYMQCQACHGANGEGNEMLKAPKVAGQHEWYLVSSLTKFKSGKRGAGDPDAAAMVPFAMMLNEKQIADVSAYMASMK